MLFKDILSLIITFLNNSLPYFDFLYKFYKLKCNQVDLKSLKKKNPSISFRIGIYF